MIEGIAVIVGLVLLIAFVGMVEIAYRRERNRRHEAWLSRLEKEQ